MTGDGEEPGEDPFLRLFAFIDELCQLAKRTGVVLEAGSISYGGARLSWETERTSPEEETSQMKASATYTLDMACLAGGPD